MRLSTRFRFREGDEGWTEYLAFIALPQLKEVRSLDTALNGCVDDCGSFPFRSLAALPEVLKTLPRVTSEGQYHLLFVDAENEELPRDVPERRLLGHDLSDETQTSSLLNCGPWEGRLAPLARRHNRYGLLSFDDAALAKALLPSERPGSPHSEVTIWALHDVAPLGDSLGQVARQR